MLCSFERFAERRSGRTDHQLTFGPDDCLFSFRETRRSPGLFCIYITSQENSLLAPFCAPVSHYRVALPDKAQPNSRRSRESSSMRQAAR